MKAFAVATLLCLATTSFAATGAYPASCWILSGLHGAAFYQNDGFRQSKDKFSHPITLVLNGANSSTGVPNMMTEQIGEFMAISYSVGSTFTTVEVYQVEPSAGIATYTKSLRASGIMSNLSGVKALIGTAKRC